MLETGKTISRTEGHDVADNPVIFWFYIGLFSVASFVVFLASLWPYKHKE